MSPRRMQALLICLIVESAVTARPSQAEDTQSPRHHWLFKPHCAEPDSRTRGSTDTTFAIGPSTLTPLQSLPGLAGLGIKAENPEIQFDILLASYHRDITIRLAAIRAQKQALIQQEEALQLRLKCIEKLQECQPKPKLQTMGPIPIETIGSDLNGIANELARLKQQLTELRNDIPTPGQVLEKSNDTSNKPVDQYGTIGNAGQKESPIEMLPVMPKQIDRRP